MMNSFYFANVQAEKATAMRRYNLFTAIAKTLRILEFFIAVLLLFWILARLPFVLRISGDYFRKLSVFIASPLFVFIVSNAIIATLLAKSGRLTAPNSDAADSNAHTTELYHEFLKNSADRTRSSSESEAEAESDTLLRVAKEDVVFQDKEIISDMNSAERTIQDQAEEIQTLRDSDSNGEEIDSGFPKVYRRSQSEKMKEESTKTMQQKLLRRSETKKINMENPRENLLYPQDKLSNEEFQRTIEAFIAKQMRFLREESLAIVIQNQS